MSCPKYFLFSMNFVVWIASVVILGIALSVYMDVQEVVKMFSGVELNAVPISAIAAGCALFVVSFTGCCGAIKEWKWMLCMYLVFLFVIVGAEAYFIYVVMEFRKNGNLPVKVKHWVNVAFQNHKNNNFWALEKMFHCCGSNGAVDYKSEIPARCCDIPSNNSCEVSKTYHGCGDVFTAYIERYSKYAGYGMIAVGAVELLAVIAAFVIICRRSDKFQRV